MASTLKPGRTMGTVGVAVFALLAGAAGWRLVVSTQPTELFWALCVLLLAMLGLMTCLHLAIDP